MVVLDRKFTFSSFEWWLYDLTGFQQYYINPVAYGMSRSMDRSRYLITFYSVARLYGE